MKTVLAILPSTRFFLSIALAFGGHAVWANSATVPEIPLANDPLTLALFCFDAPNDALWADAVAGRATLTAAPNGSLATGRFGRALRVAPRTAATVPQPVLTLAAADAGKSVFSVQLWVKFQGAQEGRSPMIAQDMYVFSSSGLFLRFSVDRNTLEFGVLGAAGWTTAMTNKQQFMPPAGKWIFVTAEYDGAEARLAVDGQIFSAAGRDGQPLTAFIIGRCAWDESVNADFDGWIDELRISKIPRLNTAPLSPNPD